MRRFSAVLLALMVLGACSSGGEEVGEETAESAPNETTSTTEEVRTTTEVDAVVGLGDTYTTPSGTDLTVYEFRPNTPNAEPPPADVLPAGVVWASADVEVCNGQDVTGPIGFDSWRLRTGTAGPPQRERRWRCRSCTMPQGVSGPHAGKRRPKGRTSRRWTPAPPAVVPPPLRPHRTQ